MIQLPKSAAGLQAKASIFFKEKVQPRIESLKPKVKQGWVWLQENSDFVKSRAFRRIATVTVMFSLIVTFIIATARLTNTGHYIAKGIAKISTASTCSAKNMTGNDEIWEASRAAYTGLLDDKFTIAMQTYQRPKELADTLNAILSEKIPSLHEVVVVWNDVDATPPANYTSEHGIPVRYRASKQNSLNEKLWPDPNYETQAILLSDDDVHYTPRDLEFAFQTYLKFGKNRLTGGLARCAEVDAYGHHKYTYCSNRAEAGFYSMILTNLAFSHISFLDYYSSNDTTMMAVRNYVDKNFNCEDIAFNYVHSMLTGEGPLLVNGRNKFVNFLPTEGVSRKGSYLDARSQCLTDFNKMFTCMPLIDETSYIQNGVVVI